MISALARMMLAGALALFAFPAMAQPAAQTPGIPALEKQCTAKDAVACWNLAEAYTLGRGTAANPAKAFAAFSRACDLSIGEACFMAAKSRREASDEPGAFALYRRGCEVGSGDSCLSVAISTEIGRGTPKDMKSAMVIYDRACTLRERKSCHYLSQLWASGENPYRRVDGPAAYKYAGMGCQWGYADSCVLAGHLATAGMGIPNDQAAFERYAQTGCDLGHYGGCMNVGYSASLRKDWTAAQRWYARACQLSSEAVPCQTKRDIDAYLADVAKGRAERARWDAAQAEGAAEVGRRLARGDYAGAIEKASHDMGSVEQVTRVLIAAQDAGRLADIGDIYFVSFETWPLNPRARSIVLTEGRARVQAQRRQSQATFVPSFGGSTSSWTPSTSSAPTQTYAAIPRISESDIYRNARESTSRSYCSAGWGCR